MKIMPLVAMLTGICLLPVAYAQTQKDGSNSAKTADTSLSTTLDWMAQTYNFTEAEVYSTGISGRKRESDASLTHQGCRLTLKENDIIADSSGSGLREASQWKRVIDLGAVDASSIQLHPSSGGGKSAYFDLEFATSGGYKNIELFFDDEPQPTAFSHGLILLFAGHDGYAPRFADAFRRAVELCAKKQAARRSNAVRK